MRILNTQSLAATVEAINEALFFGQPLSRPQRLQASRWIAERQGKPGSYAKMFAPCKRDFEQGIRLFTGEKITTNVGTRHILGQETCRALILLRTNTKAANQALEAASTGMLEGLRKETVRLEHLGREKRFGMYCCGKCSVALWRHLAISGLAQVNPERLLNAGVKKLKTKRDGKGRWKVFPFYYTLLALNEIDLPAATKEMQYTASSLERLLKRFASGQKYDSRRRTLAERILARC